MHKKYVTVIGGANLDIVGSVLDSAVPEDSNPGQIHLCAGGVGRNIAENLARLSDDVDVRLISAIGDDAFGEIIIKQTKTAGVDMSFCHILKNEPSSAYMAIVDNKGEMKLALSDMRAADKLPIDAIECQRDMIDGAELIVLDANLTEAVISFICDRFSEKHIIIDPVSTAKARHMKNYIDKFDTIKMNRMEAEFLSGMEINDETDLSRAGEYFIKNGLKRVFITMGGKGAFYMVCDEQALTPATGNAHGDSGIVKGSPLIPVNATGAGDAFTAGIAFSAMQGYGNRHCAIFASAMARITLQSLSTVSPDMSLTRVRSEMENLEKTVLF